MARISRTNEVTKLKMFKRPTTRELCDLFASGVNATLEGLCVCVGGGGGGHF